MPAVRLPFLLLLLAWAVVSPFPRGLGLSLGTCAECSLEFASLQHPDGCCSDEGFPLDGEHGHCEHISMDDPLGLPTEPPGWRLAAAPCSPPPSELESIRAFLLPRHLSGLDPPPDDGLPGPAALLFLGKSLALRC